MTHSEIISATPLQLLQASYDLLLTHLELTQQSLAGHLADDPKTPHERVVHCQNILQTIISGLNLDYDIAQDLLPLYLYLNTQLIECQTSVQRTSQQARTQAILGDVQKIVATLAQGIHELPDIDMPEQPAVYTSYNRDGERAYDTTSHTPSTEFKA